MIEVANSSRVYDLGVKAALYARVGVPEYWVVDLLEGCVAVHRGPGAGGYTEVRLVDKGVVRALHHPGLVLDVADVLTVGT